jgi:CubicO group peptidase (beta-lactamase class C family)
MGAPVGPQSITSRGPSSSHRRGTTLTNFRRGRAFIGGEVDEGFGPVADVFARNFRDRGELGASCTVFVRGCKVVDIWGGVADARSGRPWTPETAAVIFSCTKGILAICAYLLVQSGRLDLDAPVADHWPEFAKMGKASITARILLSHRAGLPALDRDLSLDDVLGWDPVIRAIEAQQPMWVPGTAHRYHSLTFGWLVGELIRRINGRSPGQFFRETLGDPIGLRTWIGLPDAERATVARMEPPLPDDDSEFVAASVAAGATPLAQRSSTMGGAFAFPADSAGVTFNDPAIQAAEIPGGNGISTARSLARLYAGCVSEIGGPRILTTGSVEDALVPRSWGQPLFGGPDAGHRWGTGFMLASPPHRPMLGASSFGHDGAGGQVAFADSEWQVGFGYLANQMGGIVDIRANELVRALAECISADPPAR